MWRVKIYVDILSREITFQLKTGYAVPVILQQFIAVSSGYSVLRPVVEFVPWSTKEAFNQFENFNDISTVAAFLKELQTKLRMPIIICKASKFREQSGETILDSLEQFCVLDGFQTAEQ